MDTRGSGAGTTGAAADKAGSGCIITGAANGAGDVRMMDLTLHWLSGKPGMSNTMSTGSQRA
jgi:hypothetical protein